MALVIDDDKKYKIRLLDENQGSDKPDIVLEVEGRKAKELMVLGKAVLVFEQAGIESQFVEKR